MREIPIRPSQLNFTWCFLVLALIFQFLPFALYPVVPTGDGLYLFELTHYLYSGLFTHGTLPEWLPYGNYGMQTDYYQVISLGPAAVLVGTIGMLFHVSNVMALFKWIAFIELLILLLGSYLLASQLYKNKLTITIVCISVVASTFWIEGYPFNLKIIYALPLAVYLINRALESGSIWALGLLGLCLSSYLMGNVPYFLAIHLWISFLYSLTWIFKDRIRFPRFTWRDPGSIVFLAAAFLIGLLAYRFAGHSLNFLTLQNSGRDVLSAKSHLSAFLNYGGKITQYPFHYFLSGFSQEGDVSRYMGLLLIPFFVWSFFLKQSRASAALIVSFLGVLAIWSAGLGADAIFNLFPTMSYYRHIGLLMGVLKTLAALIAGHSLDHFLSLRSGDAQFKPRRKILSEVPLFYACVGLSTAFIALDFSVSHFLNESAGFMGCSEPIIRKCASPEFKFQFSLFIARTVPYLLASLCLLFYRFRPGVLLLACLIIDLTSVQWAHFKAHTPLPSLFSSRAAPFSPTRLEYVPQRAIFSSDELTRSEFHYLIAYAYSSTDPCMPRGRVDFFNENVSELLLSRGLPPALIRTGQVNDPFLLGALGCDLPKIRVTQTAHFVETPEDAASWIQSPLRKNQDIVIVGASTAQHVNENSRSAPVPLDQAESLDVVRFTNDQIDIKVEAGPHSGKWLYYADAFHPGWKAWVNGRKTEIFRANMAFKAIPLAEGHNLIELKFSRSIPDLLNQGVVLLVSLIAGLLIVVVSVHLLRRNPT